MALDAMTLQRCERMFHHGHAFQSRPQTPELQDGDFARRRLKKREKVGMTARQLHLAITAELAEPQRPRTGDVRRAPDPVGTSTSGADASTPSTNIPTIKSRLTLNLEPVDKLNATLWPRPGVVAPTDRHGAPPWPSPPPRSRYGGVPRTHRGASVPRAHSPLIPLAPWSWREMQPGAQPAPLSTRELANPSPPPPQEAIMSAASIIRRRIGYANERENVRGRWRPDAAGTRALYQLFSDMDANSDGVLSKFEFGAALEPLGLSDEEVETLYQSIDRTGIGRVDFRTFVASCLPAGGNRATQNAFITHTAPTGAGAGATRTVAPLEKRAPMRSSLMRSHRHLEEAKHAWDLIAARQEIVDPELGAALELTRRRMHKGMGDGAGLGFQALGVVPADVRGAFQVLDTTGSGKLSLDQVSRALDLLKVKVPLAAIQRLVAHLDRDGDGHIDESEFHTLVGSRSSGQHYLYRPYRDGLAHKPTF